MFEKIRNNQENRKKVLNAIQFLSIFDKLTIKEEDVIEIHKAINYLKMIANNPKLDYFFRENPELPDDPGELQELLTKKILLILNSHISEGSSSPGKDILLKRRLLIKDR